MNALGVRPSFATGFAQGPGESEYPELWRGLVAAYDPSLGQTGSRLIDWSGKGNHGTLVSGATWAATKFGSGISLPTVVDGIDIGDLSGYFNLEGTFVMWCKLNIDPPLDIGLSGFAKIGTDDGQSDHYPYTDGNIYLGTFRNDRLTLGNIGVDKSKWHQVVITQKPGANNWKFYQNGVEYYNTTGDDAAYVSADCRIGRSAGSQTLNGLIGQVLIYNRALIPAEISLLHQLRKQVA